MQTFLTAITFFNVAMLTVLAVKIVGARNQLSQFKVALRETTASIN